jgi:hypothetical protein
MIEKTIESIESRLRETGTLTTERKAELLDLLGELKEQMAGLPETHPEHAESITGFVDLSTREATRETRDPQLAALAIEGLASSAREFESTHPKLTDVVNRICAMLSDLGI